MGDYYTLHRQKYLQRVLATGRRDYIVGLTEDHDWVTATLHHKLRLKRANVIERPHSNNTSRRKSVPVLPPDLISAWKIAARNLTNFARLSEMITTAGYPITA